LHQPTRIAWVASVFVSVWWVWLLTTMFTNRFRVDDMTHRLLVLLQMFLVILVAIEAHAGVVRDGAYLSATYAALILTVGGMYAGAARARGPAAGYARRRATWLLVAAGAFALATALPSGARGVMWTCALVLTVEPALRRSTGSGDVPPVDQHHLLER